MTIRMGRVFPALVAGLLWFGPGAPWALAQPGPRGGIYDKPYLTGDQAVRVGGYVDMEFSYTHPDDTLAGTSSTFDQHRLIPFLFAEVTPKLHFSTEIEYEHGGNVESGGEISVEYMVVDYRFADAIQARTGIILSPLGRFNLVHDSPLNDLTDRPLVDREIIPTTLSEAGVGLFGVVYPSKLAVFNYEAYLVNGFNEGIIADSAGTVRLREGRGSPSSDNNTGKSIVARFDYSPRLGLDLGLSAHHGKYDDAGMDNLTLVAADLELRRGPAEVLLEYAQAEIERSHLSLEKQTQQGFYLQGNLHFLQDKLLQGSTFTGVVRWDWVDFAAKGSPDNSASRLTFGLNFRPVEKAVIKTDFQTNWQEPAGGSKTRQDQRFLASVALYF